jgi:hypothetical protein
VEPVVAEPAAAEPTPVVPSTVPASVEGAEAPLPVAAEA